MESHSPNGSVAIPAERNIVAGCLRVDLRHKRRFCLRSCFRPANLLKIPLLLTWVRMVVALPVCLTDYACAPASVHEQPAAPVKAAVPHGAGAAAEGPKPRLAALAGEPCSIPALVELWRERTGGPASDLPVGPGDVIDISVPEVDELQNQKVR